MLLEDYKAQDLLTLQTVLGETSESGLFAFRGDLVLKEGPLHESSNKRKPPESVLAECVILADDSKIKFISGSFDRVSDLETFMNKYSGDLAEDCKLLFFVINASKDMQVEMNGSTISLIALREGMAWNELMEVLYIEKSDLKGQSAEDKVITVYKAMDDYKAKAPVVSFEEALTNVTEAKRQAWGAI